MQKNQKVENEKDGNGSTKTMAKAKLGKDWN
jgi:hypothetical protein